MPKISDLPAAAVLAGTEPVPVVQGGATAQASAQAIANLALGEVQPVHHVYSTSNEVVAQGDTVTFTAATTESDAAAWSVGNPDRLTIQAAGWYTVGFDVTTLGTDYGGPSNQVVVASITKNWDGVVPYLDATVAFERFYNNSGALAQGNSHATAVYLEAGDYLQLVLAGNVAGLLVESNPSDGLPGGFPTDTGPGTLSPHLYAVPCVGARGPQGPVSVAVGTVTDVAYGAPATVTNSGTAEDLVLDFAIPAGPPGAGAFGWTEALNLSGAVYSGWTEVGAGTWSSDGAKIIQSNSAAANYSIVRDSVVIANPAIIEAELEVVGTDVEYWLALVGASAETNRMNGHGGMAIARSGANWSAYPIRSNLAFGDAIAIAPTSWAKLRLVYFGTTFTAYLDGAHLYTGSWSAVDTGASRFAINIYKAGGLRSIKAWTADANLPA